LAADEAVEYLDIEDLLTLSTMLLGESPPIRDVGLLESAAARPRASAFGEDAYPDLWSKAAALLHSIVKNHALVDGNKRLGWLATAVFLELNGIDVSVSSNDGVYALVMDLAATDRAVPEIADRLRRLLRTS
jgi:death-on-curing protein